jgi:hypothetical protein
LGDTFFGNKVLSVIRAMTLTVFIALCLLGCGFMLYVLLQWIRDTHPKNAAVGCEGTEPGKKQPPIVPVVKPAENRVKVRTATDSQFVDKGKRRGRLSQSLNYSERIAYERIARFLTPRKKT